MPFGVHLNKFIVMLNAFQEKTNSWSNKVVGSAANKRERERDGGEHPEQGRQQKKGMVDKPAAERA